MLVGAELRALLENPKPWMRPGFFLVIEGADGVGKDTQAQLLYESLKSAGHTATIVRDPGTTPLGEKLREIVKSAPLPAEEQLLLFTAARISLAREIEKRLAAGEIVISTRWFLSTLVYQIDCPSHTPELYGPRTTPEVREEIAIDLQKRLVGLVPDFTITLVGDFEESLDRRTDQRGGGDHFDLDSARNYARNRAYFKHVGISDDDNDRLLDTHYYSDQLDQVMEFQQLAEKIRASLSKHPKWRYLTRPKATQKS